MLPVPDQTAQTRAFLKIFALGALLLPVAGAFAYFSGINLAGDFNANAQSLFWSVVATTPLLAGLWFFIKSDWPPLASFRASQLEFYSRIGFRMTLPRAAALALLAGVSEELLFRGVFQQFMSERAPIIVAIIVPNIIFGLLHAQSSLYALLAGVIGTYLGVLYWATGSLAAPIVTHALYDFVALFWTQFLLDKRAASLQSGLAKSSGSSVSG